MANEFNLNFIHRLTQGMYSFCCNVYNTQKNVAENAQIIYTGGQQKNVQMLWKFQENNDAKQSSTMIKVWFRGHDLQVTEVMPSQSPDLNPVTNFCGN